MSNWSHVAGVFRIDYIKWDEDTPELDFDKLIGKECIWESDREVWRDMDANPDSYLPMGSEGSLQKSIWINPQVADVTRYTVSVFGDLRHHDSCDDIIEWFREKCSYLAENNVLRQAVITVTNEHFGTKTWTFTEEENNDE